MKNIKHLTALFLSTFLFLGALNPVSAYMKAEYDRNSYPEEKYMGMLRVVSYTRESLDTVSYTHLDVYKRQALTATKCLQET